MTMKTTRLLSLLLPLLTLASGFAVAAGNKPVNLTGKWQLSWEARLGTERDTIVLEQAGSKLTGIFQARFGTPKVSGTIEGNNVALSLDFPGTHPYTLIFKGAIDGDKMSGKLEVEGVETGYDPHGENVAPASTRGQQPASP